MKYLTTIAFIVLTGIFLFSSCKSPSERDSSKITSLEEQLKNQGARPDKEQLHELLSLYISYADKYPDDSLAQIYLYHGVNLCMGMGDGEKAMELIDKSINKYPNGMRLAETIFLKAYVYENYLSNFGKATEIYRDFVNRFPTHELADDAGIAIQNMGKTPEELVKEFEARK
jgi:tetratricopeptide (TPR) repeat protein